jgi:NAD(P)H-dependent flavin oxidoreductase YrpB (nitropropane dioxygenase family)
MCARRARRRRGLADASVAVGLRRQRIARSLSVVMPPAGAAPLPPEGMVLRPDAGAASLPVLLPLWAAGAIVPVEGCAALSLLGAVGVVSWGLVGSLCVVCA